MSALAIGVGGAAVPGGSAARDRVDAFLAPLDLTGDDAAAAWDVLCDAERAHAVRLRVGAARWVAARAALRRVLGGALGVGPTRVAFTTGRDGRPRLATGPGDDLRFSLSHSGRFALVALRLGHDVGVDLEEVRDGVDCTAIVRDQFAPAERAEAERLMAADPRAGFFRAWARREALLKAAGRGLGAALEPREAARFRVRDLAGPAGYAAAVASEGDGWRTAFTARAAVPAEGPPWTRRAAAAPQR